MTSLFFHQFWAVDAAQRTGQTINFLKNLSIIGGGSLPAALSKRAALREA